MFDAHKHLVRSQQSTAGTGVRAQGDAGDPPSERSP
jgi:hypothetical protein